MTVITHEANKPFYEQAWARPRTIEPDLLSKSPKPAIIRDRGRQEGDDRRLADPRAVPSRETAGTTRRTLIAYLPKERILMYGDGYNPPAGDDPRDPTRTPEYGLQLYETVQRLKLNPSRIAPVHGRVVPFENLKIAIAGSPTS